MTDDIDEYLSEDELMPEDVVDELEILLPHKDKDGKPAKILLKLNRELPYKLVGSKENKAMKVNTKDQSVSFDHHGFIMSIWKDLVVDARPKSLLNPVKLKIYGHKTSDVILDMVWKYYKNKLSDEEIEQIKKK